MSPRTLSKRGARRGTRVAVALLLGALVTSLALAQFRGSRRSRRGGDFDRNGVPNWEIDPNFSKDVFTFARIRYGSWRGGWGRRGGGGWATDFPDSDLNFSFRLQQLTSLKVEPRPHEVTNDFGEPGLELTEDRLFDYPFIYMIEPGNLYFEATEAAALRRYLFNGGFLMVDDFWGDDEWDNFYDEIKKVFPDREPQEVPLEHDIFSCVYKLDEKPQIPSINAAQWGRSSGITWERGEDSRIPHYKAFYDDNGRMIVFICHNTDLGDGWEREGEDEWYFHEFSEKKAYPLGINIVTYAMTH